MGPVRPILPSERQILPTPVRFPALGPLTDPGPTDGVMGLKTKMALKKFGDANGVKMEGETLEVVKILLDIVLQEMQAQQKRKNEESRAQ